LQPAAAHGAREDRSGAPATQIFLAQAEQLAADALSLKRRPHGDEADDAVGLSLHHAGVDEADALAGILGNDQAGGIEVRLGEDETLEGRRGAQGDGAAPLQGSVPDLNQTRRIGVAKRSIQHGGLPHSTCAIISEVALAA
jgi:hypothetical protein